MNLIYDKSMLEEITEQMEEAEAEGRKVRVVELSYEEASWLYKELKANEESYWNHADAHKSEEFLASFQLFIDALAGKLPNRLYWNYAQLRLMANGEV